MTTSLLFSQNYLLLHDSCSLRNHISVFCLCWIFCLSYSAVILYPLANIPPLPFTWPHCLLGTRSILSSKEQIL